MSSHRISESMKSGSKQIKEVRAFTLAEGGGDYHAQNQSHWIVGQIATPMSRYEEYRKSRKSWGIDVLGTVVVEVEASDGTIGFGISTGGIPAAWLIENHFSRFVVGKNVEQTELIWDQMFRASIYYGRKGIALNAISAIDLALWDLLGRIRNAPVCDLIGGRVRDHIEFYATGPRPDLAKSMGFIGGKMPLVHGPASGEIGFRENVESFQGMREKTGEDFWLMYDCWMSLDLPYAKRMVEALKPSKPRWIEECFLPDDYWSYRELKKAAPPGMLVTTGEHEATRYGFRILLEWECADIIQPDVGWCGGLTELLRISAMADAAGVWTIPHGSSVYSYHFVITRHNSPFAEFLMMAPDAASVVPMFHPLLIGEPVPQNGRLQLSDKPGFGVELNRSLDLTRLKKSP
ncbi:MAG: L-rhamnonate dehydratase [Thaumarchaeota archaeon]|nr:L-rhamnonate dehydratase [Nitrososphaerota archaeon]